MPDGTVFMDYDGGHFERLSVTDGVCGGVTVYRKEIGFRDDRDTESFIGLINEAESGRSVAIGFHGSTTIDHTRPDIGDELFAVLDRDEIVQIVMTLTRCIEALDNTPEIKHAGIEGDEL